MEEWKEDLTEQQVEELHFVRDKKDISLKKQRYEICKSCKELNSFKICNICHCFMPFKTILKYTVCPKGKW